MNLPIRVTIKDKHGETMTKLRVRGPQNVDKLLLWIWRDLALCMLAKGTKQDKERVSTIIEDLETIYGFPVLERLLRGGKKSEFIISLLYLYLSHIFSSCRSRGRRLNS